ELTNISQWLKRVLPREEGSGVKNIIKPKYNYKPADLDRNLKALWQCKGVGFVHPRTLFQFHLLLLLYCHSGARKSALLKPGVKYKVRGGVPCTPRSCWS